MQEYKTTGIIRVNTGYVGLDKRQAAARRSRVKPTKTSGVYEILKPVEFKAGETIRLKDPDKIVAGKLQTVDSSSSDSPGKKSGVPAKPKTQGSPQ